MTVYTHLPTSNRRNLVTAKDTEEIQVLTGSFKWKLQFSICGGRGFLKSSKHFLAISIV